MSFVKTDGGMTTLIALFMMLATAHVFADRVSITQVERRMLDRNDESSRVVRDQCGQ